MAISTVQRDQLKIFCQSTVRVIITGQGDLRSGNQLSFILEIQEIRNVVVVLRIGPYAFSLPRIPELSHNELCKLISPEVTD